MLHIGILPPWFKKAKIIAIVKPGKNGSLTSDYRPISLLSCMYKHLERLILNRISPIIEAKIPKTQAGFRSNRSCTDQALALTSFIESGFQKKLKTGVVFVDLSAAYDTVLRHGLLLKLIQKWCLASKSAT